MTKRYVALCTFFCVFIAACQSDQASSPRDAEALDDNAASPPSLPETTYPSMVRQEISIEMSDGVRLASTVSFPSEDGSVAAPGPFPVVVSITPYGRNGVYGGPDPAMFAQRGIIAAAVDTRGTGGSEGNLNENYFSPLEAHDGYEVIEFFGTQNYSTGKVGMAGGSYLGITQLAAAGLQPPHLTAIAPQVPLSDLYREGYTHGGIINMFFDLQYIGVQGGPGLVGSNTDPALADMTVIGKLEQLTGTPIMFDYLARPYDDPFYIDRSPITTASQIQVPVLLIGGWRDGLSQRGNPELFHVLSQRPDVETRMYMDPCTHKGCGAPFAPFSEQPGADNLNAVIFEFLSRYLLDAETPDRPNVRVYLQGADRYADAEQWPPAQTDQKRFFLTGGSISPEQPTESSIVEYFTNPASGLSMALDQYGTVAGTPYVPLDQRLESANGLTWRTPVLNQELILIGPSTLHLVASSSAEDTDWVAKLADVAPDGSETIITNGYLRASHRELDPERSRPGVPYHTHTNPQSIPPGEMLAYEIEIWPTAYAIATGHQLQLRLTSADTPTHAPVKIQFDIDHPENVSIEPMPPAVNQVSEGMDGSFLMLPIYSPQATSPPIP